MNAPRGPSPRTSGPCPDGPLSACKEIISEGHSLREAAFESVLRVLARLENYGQYASLRFLLERAHAMMALGYVDLIQAHRHSDVAWEWVLAPGPRKMHPWFVCSSAAGVEDFLTWCSRHARAALCDETLAWALLQCMQYSLWACGYSTVGVHRGWTPLLAGHDPQWFVRIFGRTDMAALMVADCAAEFSKARIEARFQAYCRRIAAISDDSED